jgi:hypothetical protein
MALQHRCVEPLQQVAFSVLHVMLPLSGDVVDEEY